MHVPGHAWIPRTRLSDGPIANLKLASGCDRRCTFCAIPSFRGAFVSRTPDEVVAEAAWLGMQGVRELVLVSENSTSYGKDLGGTRALVRLLPRLTHVPGIDRVRVSYLQPAEMRPDLIEVIATTPGVAPYFDLSFQHASPTLLRRMRRFGGREDFLDLCARIRALAPEAGIRSNVIVGFPGETEDDLAELEAFLEGARLDAVGVFGYSDEDGTEAAGFDGKLPAEEIAARVERITALTQELMAQRAEDRSAPRSPCSSRRPRTRTSSAPGRAAHQAPEVDGECVVERGSGARRRRDGAGGRRRHRRRGPRRQTGRGRAPQHPPRAAGRLGVSAGTSGVPPPGPPPPLLNIANVLTGVRLLLVPVFLLTLFADAGQNTGWRYAATGVFVVAAITDRFDGELARSPRARHRVRHARRPHRRQGPHRRRADRPLRAPAPALVGHRRDHGPRAGHHRAALPRPPPRDHRGEPRRQGEDAGADDRHRAVPPAAGRRVAPPSTASAGP